jgi:hypothetical protein
VTVDPSDATQVIEDGVVEPRLRRPLDLVRFVIALGIAAVTVLIAYFATSTTAGLDSDIASGVQNLPGPLVLVLNIIGGIGTLGLPIAAAVMLILRKRLRQLFDALVDYLGLLDAGPARPWDLRRLELDVLGAAGLAPSLLACARCGRSSG